MKKKNIGLDLDDVIFRFYESFINFHNKKYGTSYLFSDITSYEIWLVWNIPFDEMVKRVSEFYESTEHENATPVEGSIGTINRLINKFDIHIVTARPDHMREFTEKWLRKYLPALADKVHYTNQYVSNSERTRNKSQVCTELGLEIFVDDSISNANDISGVSIPVLLLDRPWNQDNTKGNITRVYDWNQIEAIINKLQQ